MLYKELNFLMTFSVFIVSFKLELLHFMLLFTVKGILIKVKLVRLIKNLGLTTGVVQETQNGYGSGN